MIGEPFNDGQVFNDAPGLPWMVPVPAGSFWMGADDAEDKFASPLEKPRHGSPSAGHSPFPGRR